MVKLFSHQESNSHALLGVLKKYGAALDGSDTGTGKSLTALQLCKMIGAQPLIISRKAVLPSWEKNCKDLGITPFGIYNYEALRTKGFPHGHVIEKSRVKQSEDGSTSTSKTYNYQWNPDLGRVILVFDEAQGCRNYKSIQSKSLIRAAERYKTLIVSATPFGSPLEAQPIGLALKLFSTASYFPWMLTHGARKNPFGHYEFVGDKHPEKGEEYLKKIHAQLYPSRGVRTRRSDIPGFPATLIDVMALETGNGDEITAVYEEMLAASVAKDYEKAREGLLEELHDLAEPLPITRDLRLRQKAELLKCSAMADQAIAAADKGESVAIYLNQDASVEAMMKYLKTDCVVRGQGQNGQERFKKLQSFEYNKSPFIIVNCAAGGAGIGLHDPHKQKPRTSLISPPQSATLLKQILGRPQRLGGGYSTQYLCFAYNSIEEKVMTRVRNKLNNIDLIQDSDLDLSLDFNGGL